MASKKKLLQAAAASSAGGDLLDVDDVFSTFLYTGDNSTQTITNNIDLSGEGGLVWIKERKNAEGHRLIDTARGNTKMLRSDATAANYTIDGGFNDFTSTGFTLKTDNGWSINSSSEDYVSWTFRKAPKFLDVVTYTGNTVGSSAQTISHGLGSTPGFIIVKRYSINGDWVVWHRYNANGTGFINLTDAFYTTISSSFISSVGSTSFTVGESANTNGESFVAYIFAHNDGDGEFGPDSDQDIIKCGSYTGTGSSGNNITLGFEPQFLMMKRTDSSSAWEVVDTMRGFPREDGESTYLRWNASSAEATASNMQVVPSATGFTINSTNDINASGSTWIYMAIRRGPLAAPEDATDVFDVKQATSGNPSTVFNTGFDVDMNINTEANSGSPRYNFARLMGVNYLNTDGTAAENGGPSTVLNSLSNVIDLSSGWWGPQNGVISYSWRRAPSFFDVVAYSGTGSNRTISHNLGAVPEMMWVRNRETSNENWIVYHKDVGATKYLMLDKTDAEITNSTRFNDTAPTASVFTVGTDQSVNSPSAHNHIAYLFATVANVSKVGSVTLNGSTQNVDCGFSSGARFVLLKRIDSTTAGWWVWDSARGIVSGNDPYLELNTTSAEVTNTDYIDPYASGFTITNNFYSAGNWIFYAIAA